MGPPVETVPSTSDEGSLITPRRQGMAGPATHRCWLALTGAIHALGLWSLSILSLTAMSWTSMVIPIRFEQPHVLRAWTVTRHSTCNWSTLVK
jgi:hypothetical protein